MASRRDERVVFGLLYLWLRDGELPLTLKTVRYIREHCRALLSDEETRFSSEDIVAFIEENRFVQRVVCRIRQRRHGGRMRPRARITTLDNEG